MEEKKEPRKRGPKPKERSQLSEGSIKKKEIYDKYTETYHLTEKMKYVIKGVFQNKSRKQAGIDAGYSEKSAASYATNILNCEAGRKYLRDLYAVRFEAEDELVQQWKAETSKIAFTDRTELIKKITANNLTMKPFEDWPEDIRSCVKGMKKTRDGIEIIFESKINALESLGRHLGVYDADNRQKKTDGNDVKIYLPDNGRNI